MSRTLIVAVTAAGTLTVGAAGAYGASWTSLRPLPGVAPDVNPALTLAPNGVASAIVVQTGSSPRVLEVARKRRTARGWTRRAQTAGIRRSRLVTPRVHVDGRGRAAAAWSDARGIWVSLRRSTTGAWTRPRLVSRKDRPQRAWGWDLAVSRRGQILVTWHTPESVRAAIGSMRGPITRPQSVSAQPGLRRPPPAAAITPDGSLLVVWVGSESGTLMSARRASGDPEFFDLPEIEALDPVEPHVATGGQNAAGLLYSTPVADNAGGVSSVVRYHDLPDGAPAWSEGNSIVEVDFTSFEAAFAADLSINTTGRAVALLETIPVDVPGDSENVDVTTIPAGATGPARISTPGFQYESGARLAPARRGTVVGWYEQGEPGITTAPRLRETYVVSVAPGASGPRKRVRLGGNRAELRGLFGGPGGAAALVRNRGRFMVSLYRG